MNSLSTIARPYAKAILEIAAESNSYSVWSKMLDYLSIILTDPHVINLVNNHDVSTAEKANIICNIKPGVLNAQGVNLVKLLAENKRLLIIPELFKAYEKMRQQAEKEINLNLITAEKISDQDMQKLFTNINNKFSGKTKITSQIDPGLLGGGKIKIGDRVIDSSIKSRLLNLHKHLAKQ